MQIRRLEAALGAEVFGMDLRNDAGAKCLDMLGLLVFRDQELAYLEQSGLHKYLKLAVPALADRIESFERQPPQ